MKLKTLTDKLNFSYINSSITDQNFPYTKMPKGEVKVFHFNKIITTKEAEEAMDKENYRPATIHEMLVHAKDNWGGKEWWVALGSRWQDAGGDWRVPCLGRYGSERYLHLYWDDPDSAWDEVYRFVGCQKVSKDLETLPLGSQSGVFDPSVVGRLVALEEQMKKLLKIINI